MVSVGVALAAFHVVASFLSCSSTAALLGNLVTEPCVVIDIGKHIAKIKSIQNHLGVSILS